MAPDDAANLDKPELQDSQSVVHKERSPDSAAGVDEKDDVDNIRYPEPWKWEKFFIGGRSPKTMLKFKNPKTMYRAINIFAGIAIMFYGYDQGVMSQVNLNEDYWDHSKDIPLILMGNIVTFGQWGLIRQRTTPEMSLQREASWQCTMVAH